MSKHAIKGLTAGVLLVAGSAVAAPAAQADSGWTKVNTVRSCNAVSGVMMCDTTTTWKRNSGFCDKPAGSLTGGIQAWYLVCYKTT